MLFSGSATALAILSLISYSSAQTLDQKCQYKPEWKSCNGLEDKAYDNTRARLQCAAMKVAKTWEGYEQFKGKPEIILRLIRYVATKADNSIDEDANSIVMNPGGPGSSGVDSVLKSGWYYNEISGNKYHVIGFDPRGTGLNEPYSCVSPGGGPGVDLSNDLSFKYAFDHYTAKAAKCKADNPDIGTRIDTLSAAFDVSAISTAVNKDGLIRYLGYSYGTLLGNVIARQFGARVDRMVLDGNIDPNSYYYGSGVDAFTDVDGATRKFLFDCSEGTPAQCAWHGATQQTYAQLVKKYEDWVGTDGLAPNRGRPSDAKLDLSRSSTVRNFMVGELKQPENYVALAKVLQDWWNNPQNVRNLCSGETVNTYQAGRVCNAQRKRQSIDPNYDPTQAGKASTSNANEAITCLDGQLRPQGLSETNYKRWAQDSVKITKYANDVATIGIYNCAPWQQDPQFAWPDAWKNVYTEKTILFVQTYYDTVTPNISGRNAASYYQKSQIVFTNGQGHCSSAQRSSGLEAALKDYWKPTGQVLPQDLTIPKTQNNGDTVFGVQNPNPFTKPQPAAPVQPDKTIGEDAGAEQAQPGQQAATDQTSGTAKIRRLFSDIDARMTPESPYARYDIRGRPTNRVLKRSTLPQSIDFETCDSNSTTTTSATSTAPTTPATTGYGNSTTTATGSGTITKTESTTKSTTSTKSDIPKGPSGPYPSVDIGKPTPIDNDNAWYAWSTTSTKPKDPESTTWGPWSSKTNSWEAWTSQKDSIPVTKTICAKQNDCKTQIVAVPTKTVYVEYVTDVCETGLTTKIVTVTATCTKGCDSKPTGVPQGYTTTAIYCSACAEPSTVTITIKVSETAKASEWSSWTSDPAKTVKPTSTGTASQWSSWVADGSSAKVSTPAAASSTWAAWNGAATGSSKPASGTAADNWSAWATATGSSPVAKYTGAASAKTVASGSLFAAVFAGLFML